MEWITTNLPFIISIVSLLVSIALVLCFIISSRHESDFVKQESLSIDIIRRVKNNESQLNDELQKMIEKYSSPSPRVEKSTSPQSDMVTLSPEQIQKLVQIVTDNVLQLLRPDLAEFNRALDRLQSIEENSQSSTQKGAGQILYASAANEDNGEFYTISEKSNQETIFELSLKADGTKAEFEVYRGAEKMVLDTPDYLLGSCLVQRKGKSSVETNHKGEAIFSDGKWKVIKPAEVTLK